jgi:hypothetical protein
VVMPLLELELVLPQVELGERKQVVVTVSQQ